MTRSVAEPCPDSPAGPVLRRLVDILPPPEPAPPPPETAARPGPDPTAPAQVERTLRAAVEILGGMRPARQLAAVLRPDLLDYLVSLQAAAGPLQPRVRKVLARMQGAGTLEAVAVVTLRTGVRAMAARFERQPDAGDGSRWRCTALQLRLTSGDVTARRRARRV